MLSAVSSVKLPFPSREKRSTGTISAVPGLMLISSLLSTQKISKDWTSCLSSISTRSREDRLLAVIFPERLFFPDKLSVPKRPGRSFSSDIMTVKLSASTAIFSASTGSASFPSPYRAPARTSPASTATSCAPGSVAAPSAFPKSRSAFNTGSWRSNVNSRKSAPSSPCLIEISFPAEGLTVMVSSSSDPGSRNCMRS